MKRIIASAVAGILFLQGCGEPASDATPKSEKTSEVTVLINADIVTMDTDNPSANAMAYSDGVIVAVGEEAEVHAAAGVSTVVRDLDGRTIVPGFFETHDHMFLASSTAAITDVSPFTTPTLAEALEKIGSTAVGADGWVSAFGADQELYEERKGPTRDLLDELFPSTPVIVFHLSGHGGFANSEALRVSGVDESTPDPQGGFFDKDEDGRLTGYLAGQPALFAVRGYPQPTVETARLAAGQRAARGVTTASDFSIMSGDILDVLVETSSSGDLAIRLVGGVFVTAPDFEDILSRVEESENDLLRIPFIKTWTDGSLQGGTGDLLDGYFDHEMGGDGAQGSQEMFNEQIKLIYERGMWPAIHANGDGAVETALSAIAYAQQQTGLGPDSGVRPQIIHAQVTRPEQIERIAQLGVNPTFFVTHVYYWGDLHATRTVGPDLVNRLSALGDAFSYGLAASMHNDPPVTPVNPIFNMWISVNRMSSTGKVYGADQAITAQQALAAYTINGAYQFGLEAETGSLEVGKSADFVVLDRNPLTVDKMEIRDVRVVATFLRGRQTHSDGVEFK